MPITHANLDAHRTAVGYDDAPRAHRELRRLCDHIPDKDVAEAWELIRERSDIIIRAHQDRLHTNGPWFTHAERTRCGEIFSRLKALEVGTRQRPDPYDKAARP